MTYDQQTGNVVLTINQIGPGDEGEYTCSARNQYGEAICSVFIQPEGKIKLQFSKYIYVSVKLFSLKRVGFFKAIPFKYLKAHMVRSEYNKHRTRCIQTTILTSKK